MASDSRDFARSPLDPSGMVRCVGMSPFVVLVSPAKFTFPRQFVDRI